MLCRFIQLFGGCVLVLGLVAASHAQGPYGNFVNQNAPPPDLPFSAPGIPFVDMDQYPGGPYQEPDVWTYQGLPNGHVYRNYLASPKASRMGTQFIHPHGHLLWDSTVGSTFGVMRYGTSDPVRPQGIQWDVEGSAQLRMDLENNADVQSVDFRGGTSVSYAVGPQGIKFGYYHLSSHLGDEFLLKNPNYPRLNFARDVLVLGYSVYATPQLRFYAEAGWAFYVDISKPFEFQFGAEWVPSAPTGPRGAPFAAFNGQLRQELDYGGTLTVQAGWAWLGDNTSNLLRAGLHYQNGGSNQLSIYNQFEQQIGLGLWYDR